MIDFNLGCYEMYNQVPTGMSPETVSWNQKLTDDGDKDKNNMDEDNSSLNRAGVEILLAHVLPPTDKTVQTSSRHIKPIESNGTMDFFVSNHEAHNILRPETIESIYILYQITGKPIYREMGWKMFQSLEKWCKVESGGYTSLVN